MKPTGLVLLVAAVGLFLAGGVVGFNLLTSSATTTVAAPTCSPRTIEAGEDVTPNLVTVNVYNASRTAGLANRVSILMQRRGFLTGTVANNPTMIETTDVVIFTKDKKDPQVAVVRAQFAGKVNYKEPRAGLDSDGISVLVGSNYAAKGLSEKGAAAKAAAVQPIDVCLPTLPVS